MITPRYKGKTSIPDHGNTGIINGNKMNWGDRILYVGIQEGIWTPNRVYVWDRENIWIMLEPPTETNRQNANYYLEANGDVTEGAPEAVFSFAQVRSLVASSIFANLIGAKNIVINSDGSIQSENFQTGVSGFIIKANGEAEFNDLFVRNSAIFDSEISSGPLELSKATPQSVTRSFDPQTQAATIASYVRSGTLVVSGQYNNDTINRLRVDTQSNTTGNQNDNTTTTVVSVYVRYENSTESIIARSTTVNRSWIEVTTVGNYETGYTFIYTPHHTTSTTHNLLLQGGMWFQYIMSGFTMKLTNIPTEEPAESGTVYRQGNVLMIK